MASNSATQGPAKRTTRKKAGGKTGARTRSVAPAQEASGGDGASSVAPAGTAGATNSKVSTTRRKATATKTASSKKVAARKKTTGAKRGPKKIAVEFSEQTVALRKLLDEAVKKLEQARIEHLKTLEAHQSASVRRRIEKSARNVKALERAKTALAKAAERKQSLSAEVRRLREEVTARVRHESAVARREAALARALEGFRIKFLKDYDRKLAKRTERLRRPRKRRTPEQGD